MRKHETRSNSESCVGFISLTFLRFSSTLMCIEHYFNSIGSLIIINIMNTYMLRIHIVSLYYIVV